MQVTSLARMLFNFRDVVFRFQ